jgi:hypothetical protein
VEEAINEQVDEELEEERERAFNSGFDDEEHFEAAEEEVKEDAEAEPEKPDYDTVINELKASLHDVTDRLRKTEGRYGEANSKLKTLSERLENAPKPGYPTAEEINGAIGDEEALEELRDKYSAWADEYDRQQVINTNRLGLDTFATKDDVAGYAKADALEALVSKEEMSAIMSDMKYSLRQELLLEQKHPQSDAIDASKEFQDWLAGQDDDTKALYDTPDAGNAIKLLDKYVDETNEVKKASNRRKRLDSSVPATTGSRSQQTTSRLTRQEAFDQGFEEG